MRNQIWIAIFFPLAVGCSGPSPSHGDQNSDKSMTAPNVSKVKTGKKAVPVDEEGLEKISRSERDDKIVTVWATEEGLRYTIETAEGKILVDKMSENEIKTRHPDLFRLLRAIYDTPFESFDR